MTAFHQVEEGTKVLLKTDLKANAISVARVVSRTNNKKYFHYAQFNLILTFTKIIVFVNPTNVICGGNFLSKIIGLLALGMKWKVCLIHTKLLYLVYIKVSFS